MVGELRGLGAEFVEMNGEKIVKGNDDLMDEIRQESAA